MIVRGIDNLNDWTFGKSKQDYKTGLEATRQNLKTRLQSFLGDCFFSLESGIDWFNLLGAKSITAITISVRTVILNTTDVTSLSEVNVVLDSNRLLTVKYTVNTIYGTIQNEDTITFTPSTGDFMLLEDGSFLLLEDGSFIILE